MGEPTMGEEPDVLCQKSARLPFASGGDRIVGARAPFRVPTERQGPLGREPGDQRECHHLPRIGFDEQGELAISSVPASTLGSCSTPPLLGFALFCARPTLSL